MLVVLLLVFGQLVFAEVLNLPEPPVIPDTENDQSIQNITVPETRREDPTVALDNRLAQVESSLLLIESQIASLSGSNSRIEELNNQINALSADVVQLKNRPSVENPVSTVDFNETTEQLSSRFKWSMIVAVLALLGILGVIGTNVFKRISINEQTKQEIKGYLSTYLSQGYPIESLQEQFKKSGWNPKLVDSVVTELKRHGLK